MPIITPALRVQGQFAKAVHQHPLDSLPIIRVAPRGGADREALTRTLQLGGEIQISA